MREKKLNPSFDWLPAGSVFAEGDKINKMTAPYESSLFSSSFSDIFSRKLTLSPNITSYGHSVDTVAPHFEEEPVESLEELEAHTIGNLLPSDDDLFSGVHDGLELAAQMSSGDDMDEVDFFSNVGGMDMDDDGSGAHKSSEISGGLSNGISIGEHPHGEYPSRTLFVRNIHSNVEDSELTALFEQYGDVQTLYTTCKHRGFVMISYYDIRAASNAMKALQNKPMRRRKLDIHYSIPKDKPSEKDVNPGTLLVFNLDSSVSDEHIRQIFGIYGDIKEICETPNRSHHYIEFYDIRAAEAALGELNMSEIAGKRIKIEPCRPGGTKIRNSSVQQFSSEIDHDNLIPRIQQSSPSSKSMNDYNAGAHRSILSSSLDNGAVSGTSTLQTSFSEPHFHQGISSSVPNTFSSLMRVGSIGLQSPNVNTKPQDKIDNRQFSSVGSNGCSIGFNDGVFGSAGSRSSSLPGHHYNWSNSYSQPSGMMWPNSPSMVSGLGNAYSPGRLPGIPRAPSLMPIGNHHVGSAPTANPSLWDRRHTYASESPDASGFHPGSLGSLRVSNSPHSMDFVSHSLFSHVGGGCVDMAIPSKNVGFQTLQQRSMMLGARGQMVPMVGSFDSSPNERARSRRNEGGINQIDKKQYELDLDRILRGDDNRTTLMIKNIPNKYTSKMLLAAIDERHKGTYDFIYLPIDFKNKCNVGYAFINMTDPTQIVPFYQSFNGKKWEKFNSEKVASLAYARIQGKSALIAHFQNSSLMNEDKRCRPILFNTEGPNAGDQVPFPMGVNIRTRPGKARSVNHDDIISPQNFARGEDSSKGDSFSGSKSD